MKKKTITPYWNVMLLSSYENSNTVNHLQILPLYSHNFLYENKRQTSSIVWAFLFTTKRNLQKQITDNAKVKFYSPCFFIIRMKINLQPKATTTGLPPVPLFISFL